MCVLSGVSLAGVWLQFWLLFIYFFFVLRIVWLLWLYECFVPKKISSWCLLILNSFFCFYFVDDIFFFYLMSKIYIEGYLNLFLLAVSTSMYQL